MFASEFIVIVALRSDGQNKGKINWNGASWCNVENPCNRSVMYQMTNVEEVQN